ncbi:DUF4249 domain-containing protein [Flagellimonas zhangzhouensis]|uniref:DUF4249 domain-containing protein n=1 Tax=Flagellimonas zhangzhouensis TaxID=1073328 RepID=A0A1H2QK67_9FLAO|nr:DUF4249 domain-containing protein [Allomuricauda zhangzhouensis]SDQ54253.1 protein of unknown function [Allomuricauda zhangzhouensis]SDW07613.1 protein of unknown function [Allomuricauda zhangzhouensis]
MRWKGRIYNVIFGLVLLIGLSACIKELEIETLGGDGAGMLVVEAKFTDELKTQTVYLSRSDSRTDLVTDTVWNPYIPLGSRPFDSVTVESGASLKLVSNTGTEYNFTEDGEGQYFSTDPFALEMNMEYTLQIATQSGSEYVSDTIRLAGSSEISGLYAEKAISETGVEGVAIYMDSDPSEGSPEHYRYAFEETYKVVAPDWQEYDFRLTDYDPCALPVPTYNLEIVPREVENKTCYNTVYSTSIDLLSTNTTNSSKVSRKMVRFIGKDNFIISHRYSILVKQYVQSTEANTYYGILKEFSESESLFSGIQPGALYANVRRADGQEENVLGYVEATTVTEQRLFFNYEDFFPGEELPPYAFGWYDCHPISTNETHPSYCLTGVSTGNGGCPQSIIEQVNIGLISYYGPYDENIASIFSCEGPYLFVPRLCGDCTLLGDTVVPEFWEE